MRTKDVLKAGAAALALIVSLCGASEVGLAKGVFTVEIVRADTGKAETYKFPNTVVTVGKNGMLDAWLAGSAYTVTGPYVGLISSVSYSAISSADTMTSHAGWLEAGGANAPTYSGTRATAAWSAASGGSKSFSSAASFSMTGGGTLEGAFVVLGSGASATIANTGGTLFSAGVFTVGARTVSSGDTVNVSYTVSV
jgi:hypothetical protein